MSATPVTPLTAHARQLGWDFPADWTVTATRCRQDNDPRDPTAYTVDEWLAFWCGDWALTTVTVLVTDGYSRILGHSRLPNCEHGRLPDGWVNATHPHRPYLADLIVQSVLMARSYATITRTTEP